MKIRIVEEYDRRYNRFHWVVEIRKHFFSGWEPYHSYNRKGDAYLGFIELSKNANVPSRRVLEEKDC